MFFVKAKTKKEIEKAIAKKFKNADVRIEPVCGQGDISENINN